MKSENFADVKDPDDPIIVSDTEEEMDEIIKDFQEIDAEIIDYGISEDEDEHTSPTSKASTSFSTTFSTATTLTTSNNNQDKCACIKVVDCDKYPWYYKKYKLQILEKKYFNSEKQVRCTQVVKNVSSNKDTLDKVMKKKNRVVHCGTHKTTSDIDTPKDFENKHIKANKCNEKRNNKYKEDMERAIRLRKGTEIDLKKNKGLEGMKIQTLIESDKIKPNIVKKKKKVKRVENIANLEEQVTPSYVKVVDKVLGRMGTTIEPVYNIEVCRTTDSKEDQQKQDYAVAQFSKNKPTEQYTAFKQAINTPTIQNNKPIIYDKDVKEQARKSLHDNYIDPTKNVLKNSTDMTAIKNTNNHNLPNAISSVCKDREKSGNNQTEVVNGPINYNRKKTQYKAMPKSKRIKFNKQVKEKSITNSNQHQNIEDQPGLVTIKRNISSSIPTVSVPFNESSINNDFNNSATYTMAKNKELYVPKKSFFIMNKLTQEVLKKLQVSVKEDITKSDVTCDAVDRNKSYPIEAVSTPTPPAPVNAVDDHSNTNNFKRYSKVTNTENKKKVTASNAGKPINLLERYNDMTSNVKKPKVLNAVYKQNKNNYRDGTERLARCMHFNKETTKLSNSSNTKEVQNINSSSISPALDRPSEQVVNNSKQPTNVPNQPLKIVTPLQIHSKRKQLLKILPVKSIEHYENYIKVHKTGKPIRGPIVLKPPQESPKLQQVIPQSNYNIGDYIKMNQNNLVPPSPFLKTLQQNPQKDHIFPVQAVATDCNHQDINNYFRQALTTNNIEYLAYSNSLPQNRQISTIPIAPSLTPNTMSNMTYTSASIHTHYINGQGFRVNIPTPPMTSPQLPKMPQAIRPQVAFNKSARQHVYKQPHYITPFMHIQRMPTNVENIHQERMNYMQNNSMQVNYAQQPVYSTLPGMSDPRNTDWPYDFSFLSTPPPLPHPPPPPPPPPLPPKDTTNRFEDSSIIGMNTSGLVKKINIPTPSPKDKDVDGVNKHIQKDNINKVKPTTIYVKKPTENTTLATTKIEMIKELEKPMEMESPVKTNIKRPCPTEQDFDQAKLVKYRPGPLSKKKLNNGIPPQTEKQIPGKTYSPSILPIPTYENILSEVQTPKFEKVLSAPIRKPTAKKKCLKNIIQIKPGQKNSHSGQIKVDKSKKISLEEYKMRTTVEGRGQKTKFGEDMDKP